ncbi:MAG TPA: hypothetical protein DCP25_00330 [Chloroflexi bacterium]|jgi:uncharacterized protein YjbI with pentapeptide repeats|nr:hypothetical protein [Chloroflexota bacterium]
MKRMRLRCGTACALAFVFVLPPAAHAAGRISAKQVAADLRAGRPVIRENVVVRGRLDLSTVDTVARVFECHACSFEGDVVASNVTFARTIDLSGSRFAGSVNFRGANFNAPALFRAVDAPGADVFDRPQKCVQQPLPACFEGRVDFSLAVFHDLASLDGSMFRKPAEFRDTRFTDATFNSTAFVAAAFDGAAFRGGALFNTAVLNGKASFSEADFRGHTDFSLAHFNGGADFSGAQLAQGASFFAAQFKDAPRSGTAARFQGATAGGDLNFTFAYFAPAGDRDVTANFADFVSGAALVLRDLDEPEHFRFRMDRLQVRDLRMDVNDIQKVDAETDENRTLYQTRAYTTLEASAKDRGDLAEANDAHYALQVLKSKHYSTVGRMLDYVFYRGIAGYLVRPLRPLLVLLVLVTLLASIRAFAQASPPVPESGPRRSRRSAAWHGATRRCSDLVTCFLATFSRVGLRRGADRTESPSIGQELEPLAYRILLVCALLGLANSNPTLRQMVDTLF